MIIYTSVGNARSILSEMEKSTRYLDNIYGITNSKDSAKISQYLNARLKNFILNGIIDESIMIIIATPISGLLPSLTPNPKNFGNDKISFVDIESPRKYVKNNIFNR